MNPRRPARPAGSYDYAVVGHITVDVLAGGERRVGGSAFYSALQAARLGLRTAVLTSGREDELLELLRPLDVPFALEILPAPHTTTLATEGIGAGRRQRLLAWAGPMPAGVGIDAEILHLAPVARETPEAPVAGRRFLGLTPQGLARTWQEDGSEIGTAETGSLNGLGSRCDAIVLNEVELHLCRALVEDALAAGAVVAVTAEDRPVRLLGSGADVDVPVPEVGEPVEDLGAGDVFAAALFVELAAGATAADAAAFAAAAAALRVRARGPGAIGSRAEIEELARRSGA